MIGRPGVAGSLNENTTSNTIGVYRNAIKGAAQDPQAPARRAGVRAHGHGLDRIDPASHGRPRPRPAGTAGTRPAAGSRTRRSRSPTAAPCAICAPRKKLITRLPIRTPCVPPTTIGVRNSPMIGTNTKMQAVMIPAGSGAAARGGSPGRAGPQVLGRRELAEVEPLQRRIQGQRREREVQVHQHDEHGRSRCRRTAASAPRRRPRPIEHLVDHAPLAEDRLPRVDPQQVARPERHDHREQHDPCPAAADVTDQVVGERRRRHEAASVTALP